MKKLGLAIFVNVTLSLQGTYGLMGHQNKALHFQHLILASQVLKKTSQTSIILPQNLNNPHVIQQLKEQLLTGN